MLLEELNELMHTKHSNSALRIVSPQLNGFYIPLYYVFKTKIYDKITIKTKDKEYSRLKDQPEAKEKNTRVACV